MSRLILPSTILQQLQGSLFQDENEACAILFGNAVYTEGGLARILVQELVEPSTSDYIEKSPIAAQLSPQFVATIGQRVRKTGESVVFVHSHPFPFNQFSKTDDEGERVLAEFLEGRAPGLTHAALLLTPEAMLARILGRETALKVTGIGPTFHFSASLSLGGVEETYDRQVRAFGEVGQKVISSLRVGIVGLGGTGSVIAQQLAHLGVRDFLLLDPDTLEETNLNRVVGATRERIGEPKVEVAKEMILRINPEASVEAKIKSVLQNSVLKQLVDTDFVFSCTDSHGSRALINQLAYQYYLPTIDMGVVIAVQEGKVEHVAARTQLLAPGQPCMTCGNILDAEEIRRDLLSDFERKNDPYILNATEPAPAVISLNSTIASMAITMFLSYVAGIPGNARFIQYNAITGISRPVIYSQHPTCIVCSRNGGLGKGDGWYLPGR